MSETTNPATEEAASSTETTETPRTEAPEAEATEAQPRDEQGRFKAPGDTERFERRIGVFRAQLSQANRQNAALEARLAALEQGRVPGQQQQIDPQLQAAIEQRATEIAEQKITEGRIRQFHEDGAGRYPDWQQRCNDLQGMGADAHFARLLVRMPDGARVAGALRDDPEEVERIAALPQDDRAEALGRYAARIEATPTRAVSRTPPPPKPLPGRSSPTPNVYQMEANDLARLWMKQVLDAQRK